MASSSHNHYPRGYPRLDILAPIRFWIDQFEIHKSDTAHLICRLIPCTCPFERSILLFGKTLHIPPLCKLNPLYNELIGLRFRALAYLSDVCGEDVSSYIC